MKFESIAGQNMCIIRSICFEVLVQCTGQDYRVAVEQFMTSYREHTCSSNGGYRFSLIQEVRYATETGRNTRGFRFCFCVIYDSIFKVTSSFFTAFYKLIRKFVTDTVLLDSLSGIRYGVTVFKVLYIVRRTSTRTGLFSTEVTYFDLSVITSRTKVIVQPFVLCIRNRSTAKFIS